MTIGVFMRIYRNKCRRRPLNDSHSRCAFLELAKKVIQRMAIVDKLRSILIEEGITIVFGKGSLD